MTAFVYGATGYVGKLLVHAAVRQGIDVVAGARSQAVLALADDYRIPSRVGGVADIDLAGVSVVLNAAGPFSATAAALAARCVEHGVHYLDIAGEIAEYEAVLRLDDRARAAGVMLMPGVGFGVVPTDCLARHLADRLPGATTLDIAFLTDGGVSAGTLRSMTAGFGDRGAVDDPELDRRLVCFPGGDRRCIRNPWRGDLLTAPRSTGIERVTTWIAVPRLVERAMASAHRRGDPADPPLLTRLLRQAAGMLPAGPSERARSKGSAEIWAVADDGAGGRAEATLTTPDAYVHTVDAALAIVERLGTTSPTPGFRTPAQEFGADFVLGLDDVVRHDR
ncbi:MAG: saccharopine dehydrogenase NADP-binding domain-containing protein [Ilumatobacter sp.]|uniref:saccharopine dehydrogenase family protein n=1 Tax=Ilumatobacter sp. TaxID=1967498 RepID=UPI0026380632|nr:saccharopine dehydrogenase NADP-binding domain-containing protein [Ilumatobacter sp.]MDJ0770080.1 saccharopine dehydrogenase NADP-binding domain-containing protein [Ilumatobacter sp.]